MATNKKLLDSGVEHYNNLFSASQNGKSVSNGAFIGNNLEMASLLSKLVRSTDPIEREIEVTKGRIFLDQGQLQSLSNNIKHRIKDNENIMRLFPDLEIAIQTIVTSVQSPKDMMTSELHFKPELSLFNSEIQALINTAQEELFTKHVPFKEELPQLLRNVCFETGSHIKLVLPENILDEIINDEVSLSMESASVLYDFSNEAGVNRATIKGLGFLGDKPAKETNLTLESLLLTNKAIPYTNQNLCIEDDPNFLKDEFDVVDNYNVLKLPNISAAQRVRVAQEAVSSTSVSHNRMVGSSGLMSRNEFRSAMFKNTNKKIETVMTIGDPDNTKRRSVARPLIKTIPSEACIPVCLPGDEENHVGYFFMVDIDGNFVTMASAEATMDNLADMISNNSRNNVSSALLDKAAKNITDTSKPMTLTHITKFYTSIVERNLIDKLRHGRYKSELNVSLSKEISQIMLTRALAGKFTRMVYVPKELVTYFALKYDTAGIGTSYLDEVKSLTSIRGILLFAKVMGRVKNSINITNVKIKFDPRDPDPDLHAEESIHEIMRMRDQYFPFGVNSMPDLADWVQRAGFQFSFEGHPDFPDMSYEFSNTSSENKIPDDDFDEMLRKQTYMAFGMTPEMVDAASGADFATAVANNSIMFSKRTAVIQEKINKHSTNFVRQVMTYDPIFKEEIIKIFVENKSIIEKGLDEKQKKLYDDDVELFWEYLFELMVANTVCTLPKPDETTIKSQKESFDTYKEFITTIADTVISAEFAPPEFVGEWSSKLPVLKAAYVNHHLRTWLTDNNCAPEMFDIITKDDNGKPLLNLRDVYAPIFEALAASTVEFLKGVVPLRLATDKDITNLEAVTGQESSSMSSTTDTAEGTPAPDDTTTGEGTGDTTGGEPGNEEPAGDAKKEDDLDGLGGDF